MNSLEQIREEHEKMERLLTRWDEIAMPKQKEEFKEMIWLMGSFNRALEGSFKAWEEGKKWQNTKN